MTIYRGSRSKLRLTPLSLTVRQGVEAVSDGVAEPLPLRLDLRNHSPDGFNWGYGGSGPAQLALAILAHCCGDRTAAVNHQAFKRQVVASWRGGSWEYTAAQVWEWLAKHGRVCDEGADDE